MTKLSLSMYEFVVYVQINLKLKVLINCYEMVKTSADYCSETLTHVPENVTL